MPEENFAVDLTIARGLDYYTGTVYETEMTKHPEIGSICSSGQPHRGRTAELHAHPL